jgi:phosphate uptake regulator
MESRKVQKVGVATLTVSLPKDWVGSQNLKKGDQVFILREGDTLRVVPPALAQMRERELHEYVVDADACDEEGMLERIIVGNYVLGRERIVVRAAHRLRGDHLEELRRACRRLMGLGIVEETANRVVLHCSLDPSHYPMESLVKRLYNLGVTMLDEAMEALLTRNPKLAEEAIKREDDADMMYWLIVRLVLSAQQDMGLISKLGLESPLNNAGYRVVAAELEAVADDMTSMAQAVLELLRANAAIPTPLVRRFKGLSDEVKGLYTHALAALLTRDLRLANNSLEARVKLKEAENELARESLKVVRDAGALLQIRAILDSLSRTADNASSVAKIAFNRYLERSTPLCRAEITKRLEPHAAPP